MKARMIGLVVGIFMLLLASIASPARTQSYMLYYQNHDSIYGINDLTDEPSLIASHVPETVSFSNSGDYLAYKNSEGIWISRTASWSPEKVISTLPGESFALTWAPDDTRLILRLAFWPENTEPTEQPLAYNLLTESKEVWIWGRCDQIARNVVARDFALICEATQDTPIPQNTFDVVALEWGGEFGEYDPNLYEILLAGISDFFPRPFDWGQTDKGQNIVYIAENPNYRSGSMRHSFWKFVSLGGWQSAGN